MVTWLSEKFTQSGSWLNLILEVVYIIEYIYTSHLPVADTIVKQVDINCPGSNKFQFGTIVTI
jgi:hypothetical protein